MSRDALGHLAVLAAVAVLALPGSARAQLTEAPSWREHGKLLPDDGAGLQFFGTSVVLSGSTGVVRSQKGAYVFQRSGASWQLIQNLIADDLEPPDSYSTSLGFDGTTLVLGTNTNAAYAFELSQSGFGPSKKVTTDDGGRFSSIALSGDTLLVGDVTGRSAYFFTRSGTTWTQRQKIARNDNSTLFGWSVALSGDTALIGDPHTNQGSARAYVYVRTGSTWTFEAELSQDPLDLSNTFAKSVALSGDVAMVGAYDDDILPQTTGSVHVYQRSGSTWSLTTRITPPEVQVADYFASTLHFNGSRLVAGGPNATGGGSVYVVDWNGSSWSSPTRLIAGDRVSGDRFGSALAASGNELLVGASQADPNGSSSGAAYVFHLAKVDGSGCSQDVECHSHVCTGEQVCCNVACDGLCDSCLAARNAGEIDGSCGPVKAGTDPRAACEPAACLGPTSEQPATYCDGSGACQTLVENDCSDGYLCVGTACASGCTTATECDQERGFACLEGECLIPQGSACEADQQCQTGHCTDGVCCDTRCRGQCAACAEPGREGTCSGVAGEPRGDRKPCGEADAGCEATCVPDEPDSCQYASGETVCGGACEDGVATTRLCDGRGACVERPPVECSPYACASDRCLAACETAADCAAAYRCDEGTCVIRGARCDESGSASIDESGTTSCNEYVCDVAAGTCLTRCRSSSDCATGYACNASAQTCQRTSGANESGGCGFGPPARSKPGSGLLLALLLGWGLRTRLGRARNRAA